MRIPLRQYIALLKKYMRPQRAKVIVLGIMLLAQIGTQLANPQILRAFIDEAAAGTAVETLAAVAALFIVLALAQQVFVVTGTYLSQDVGWTATNELRAELAEHCLNLDMAFHKTRTPGEWIERIDGDVTALANFFSQAAMLVLGNMLLLGAVLVVTWFEDWRIGLALTAFAVLAFYALNRSRHISLPLFVASRQAESQLYGELEEHLAGLDDIRANGAGAYASRRFAARQQEVFQTTVRAEKKGAAVVDMVSTGSFALGYIGALALGAWLFQAGLISVGTIFLVLRYTQMLRDPMSQITRQLQDLQKAGAGIVRISRLLALKPQIAEGCSALPAVGALAVEFSDVNFVYADGEPGIYGAPANGRDDRVLRGLDFALKPGRVLGLLGRTGSGKTTVARLLARLYDPGGGAIRLGGVDIRDVQTRELRRAVGMVTQDVQMFSASLRQNLTLFDDGVPDERIYASLAELGLHGWLKGLPAGLDTMLGAGGLSAGEAQLLAFARVMLKNPSLVVLDEASSRLDPATERLIERAVDRLLKDRTAIVIAHRLGTVQRADEILILEDGQIREHGQRAALAANTQSRFAQLLRTGLEEVLV
jgi:ATP-binding cassette subfamily B protein